MNHPATRTPNRESALFNYGVELARRTAARLQAADGLNCQCGHLMHAGRCTARISISEPGGMQHAFCQCGRALLMGQSRSCGICDAPTGVNADGISPIVCRTCMQRAADLTRRRMAARQPQRPSGPYAGRGWRR
jgi:hypothetical protein